jgi:hypothetical protein
MNLQQSKNREPAKADEFPDAGNVYAMFWGVTAIVTRPNRPGAPSQNGFNVLRWGINNGRSAEAEEATELCSLTGPPAPGVAAAKYDGCDIHYQERNGNA